ncbi:MAG: putative RND superfamily exporter protein, partial [Myxococcota bacterium]
MMRRMHALAGFCERHSALILVAAAMISVLAATQLPLAYDDDVVRFLPEGDPEVERLMQIADRFGAIHVALVGVETRRLFTQDSLNYVRSIHEALRALPSVRHVTSIAQLTVVQPDPKGGTASVPVVPHPVPDDLAALAALEQSTQEKDYLIGALVSEDLTSTRLILQLRTEIDGKPASTKTAAENIRKAVEKLAAPAGTDVHYGGAPFIAEEVANGSQRDLKRLAPWVCLIIVLLIVLSLGSLKAGFLALGCVGMGILWTMGLMGAVGAPLTLVSTSLPVILVALGSAYAVHLLVWHLDHHDGVDGLLHNVGWPVFVAALTTVAGFLSFLVMDLPPMREFGWQMAAGTAICTLVAMTVIPAVISRWPFEAREQTKLSLWIDNLLVATAIGARKHRWAVLSVLLVVGLFYARQLPNVATRMDTSSFFEKGSAPERADAFMERQFGGAVFLQVLVDGDMKSPAVLRAMADFQDRVRAVPGVTRVDSLTDVLGIVNQSIGSGRREVPRKRAAVALQGRLARDSDPAVALLLDGEWQGGLIQVAIGGFDTEVVRRVTDEIRSLADKHLPTGISVVAREPGRLAAVRRDAAERIMLLAGVDGLTVDQVVAALSVGAPAGEQGGSGAYYKELRETIEEDELVYVKEGTDLAALAKTVAASVTDGTLTPKSFRALIEGVADPEELEEPEAFGKAVTNIYGRISELAEGLTVKPALDAVMALVGQQPKRVKARVSAIVYDVTGRTWHVATDCISSPESAGCKPISALVSGYPIVQEAMTQSVHRNQVNSLLTSLPLVLLILIVVFRSIIAGLIGLVPTGLTLLVTFGLMGLFPERLPLDIGSSMIASIALGVGIDYAIH